MKSVLFILKRKEDYNEVTDNQIGLSTGLYNSAGFVNTFLNKKTVSNMVVVIDNSDIDREVTKHRPDVVIIEALWVVPSKIEELQALHPSVKWVIRLHSEMPFLANEGIAMEWIGAYSKIPNVQLAVNSPRMKREAEFFIRSLNSVPKEHIHKYVTYLPNYYPQAYHKSDFSPKKKEINIGCFGAVRPLKNHLVQAMAAIEFAEKIGKKLNFHINGDRVEMKGETVLSNLKGLFDHYADKGHKLVIHQWTPREEFLKLCSTMDIGMQVSFSETFNIVGADLISQGVPLVTSNEIPWSSKYFQANPTDSASVVSKLLLTYLLPRVNTSFNRKQLDSYASYTKKVWFNFLR